jgi:hypothetical protein
MIQGATAIGSFLMNLVAPVPIIEDANREFSQTTA